MESKELQQVEEHIFKLSHPLKNTKVLEKNLYFNCNLCNRCGHYIKNFYIRMAHRYFSYFKMQLSVIFDCHHTWNNLSPFS